MQTRNNNIDRKNSGAIPRDLYNLPNKNAKSTKTCNYCKKPGHVIAECRRREYNNSNSSNYYPRFQNSNNYRTPNTNPPDRNTSNPQIRTNSNFTPQNSANRQQNSNNQNFQRPSIIQRNPNYPVNHLNESGELNVDDFNQRPQSSPNMNQVSQSFQNMSF